MASKLTRQDYENIFLKLPDDLKALIVSEEMAKKVFDVSKKNNLDVDQTIALATTIGDVLFGIEPLDKFLPNLKEVQKNMPNEKLITIASDINQKIFFTIKEQLKQYYQTAQKQLSELPKTQQEEQTAPAAVKEIKQAVSRGVSTRTPATAKPFATPTPINRPQTQPLTAKTMQSPIAPKTAIPAMKPIPLQNGPTAQKQEPVMNLKQAAAEQKPQTRQTELRKDILEELTKI